MTATSTGYAAKSAPTLPVRNSQVTARQKRDTMGRLLLAWKLSFTRRPSSMHSGRCLNLIRAAYRRTTVTALIWAALCQFCGADELEKAAQFRERVQPILEKYCYSCHGNGASEGGRTLDQFASDAALVGDIKLWHAVLKNVRSGIMPPAGEDSPTAAESRQIFDWIKSDVFAIDPANPDPGRVTLRRLNRAEYRNTIRDLVGVDYDTNERFPPDDSGYGFDNIADVLSMSPLLMEKYLEAAETIIERGVALAPADSNERRDYRRFFVDGPPPEDATARDEYARKLITHFARRAYRRPVEDAVLDRLASIAKENYSQPDVSFETGVSRAFVAILASPRFVFRTEEVAPANDDRSHPLLDEYSLASRLSYFLWSTMPDDELSRLAEQGELRKQLPQQIDRMLKDGRSSALVENFAGQWLRTRDVEHVQIEPLAVLGLQDDFDRLQREQGRLRGGRRRRGGRGERGDNRGERGENRGENRGGDDKAEPDPVDARLAAEEAERGRIQQERIATIRAELDGLTKLRDSFTYDLRRAMRRETELTFDHVMRSDRSVLELINGNYTFLNEILAKHYGIEGITGDEMRRVDLPPDSPRGGLLAQGTILAVTSNPTRTSPVKRGLYVLDNILGSPAPPPPAPVPPLEQAVATIRDHEPTMREAMELHRRDPLCMACHARMDPLGLALENFNALGMWRDKQSDRPIDASGQLLTGEKFADIRELKQIITKERRLDFYRCLTEKLLTYALGRGLEYYDEQTVDQIVERLDASDGRFSALLRGVIESAPFRRQSRLANAGQ